MSATKRTSRGTKRHFDEEYPAVDVKTEKEDLIQFPFVELNENPLSTAPVSEMNNKCTDSCRNSFLEIKSELKALKRIVEEQTKLIQELSRSPFQTSMQLDNNSTLYDTSSLKRFPLNSDEDLAAIENHINDQNRELYLHKLRRLLNANCAQNLRKVLSEEILLNYNIDGKQGKKKLREYAEFVDVLLDAVNVEEEPYPPETTLKNAIQVQKKRHYRRKCAEKAKLRLKNEEEDDEDTIDDSE